MYRKAAKSSDTAANDSLLKFDLSNSESIELKIGQMNNQIRSLEKSIGELQAKVKAYRDIILRYETAFREEISLYKLQKCKLATLQAAFLHQQNFAKEIEQQLNSYLNETPPHQKSAHSTFRRIILRFFHQNKLNQNCTNLKISEIERIIHQKQQLLEQFQEDVRNCNDVSLNVNMPDRQPLALN